MPCRESVWRAADGTYLHACAWLPAGPPVASVGVVHGLGEHIGCYTALAEALTGAGFAVIGLDLRGHGRSTGPRGHAPGFPVLLDDLSLLDAEATRLCPAHPPFLYGHSLGASLALHYALSRRPALSGVVAAAPALRLLSPPPGWKVRLGRLLCRVAPAVTFDNGLRGATTWREPDPLRHSRISAQLGVDLLDGGPLALAHAAEWRLPLLLMQGSDDRVIDHTALRDFAQQVPAACTLHIWDHLGHELHTDPRRDAVFAYLVHWLRAVLARRGAGKAA